MTSARKRSKIHGRTKKNDFEKNIDHFEVQKACCLVWWENATAEEIALAYRIATELAAYNADAKRIEQTIRYEVWVRFGVRICELDPETEDIANLLKNSRITLLKR